MQCHVIVGAGTCGTAAAFAMRRAGFAGRIVLLGAEPCAPYERPALSKDVLRDAGTSVGVLHGAAEMADAGIDFRPGLVVAGVDAEAARVHTADGVSFPYDKLLLAPGGRARPLAMVGGDLAVTLRTLDDALLLRRRLAAGRRLVVIGGGAIGMEVAASAIGMGLEVTVLEAGPRILARFGGPEISGIVQARHEGQGVRVRLTTGPTRLERRGDDVVTVCDGGEEHAADIVLAAVGLEPAVELASEAGLQVDDGIRTDEFGRTDRDGIHAAGDAARFWHPRLAQFVRLENWRHAQEHGAAVGRCMAGLLEPYDRLPWAWSDQYDWNIQVAGFPHAGSRVILRSGTRPGQHTALYLDGGKVVGAATVNQGRDMRPCQHLIESGMIVRPEELADPGRPLRQHMR